MDARIILAGQTPDIIGELDRSTQAAGNQIALNRGNALANLYREQGAGIAAGDQKAVNMLAQFDPLAAQGVQSNILGMQQTRQDIAFTGQKMAALDTATQREAEAYAKSISAEQAAQEAAALEAAVKQALSAPTPQAFDAMMVEMGRPEMVGQFENRQQLGAQFMSVAEILKMNAPPEPLSKEGKLAADVNAGLLPKGTTSSPETVINMGEGDKFYETLDKSQATMFDTLMTEGIQASRTTGLVDRLETLMQQTPTGGPAVLTKLAGEIGIDVGGLGNVQAVDALINQIVPQQRQPGSGPMSDADLALFKQSVPRLINSPEGNAIIVQTMRGINKYVMDQARIANAVANREITPAQGRQALAALANPLDGFGAAVSGTGSAATPPLGPTVIDGFTIEALE